MLKDLIACWEWILGNQDIEKEHILNPYQAPEAALEKSDEDPGEAIFNALGMDEFKKEMNNRPAFLATGILLMLNAALNLAGELVLGTMSSGITSSVIDFILGLALVFNRVSIVPFVKFRVIAGLLVFSVILGAQGDIIGLMLQIYVSVVFLALLFGKPHKVKIIVCCLCYGFYLLFGVLGLVVISLTGGV